MAPRHQAPRGTRDLLPGETARWQWAEGRGREVLERYGYREIRTPIFEDYELFARTSGESSDVVQKEMYRFSDLGERNLALRPEGTASVARAYLEHGMSGQGRIHRLWYMGPMFRYGRPQKGRFRQFHQIGAEVIGTASPGADVEMIALFVDLFEAWGFRDLAVRMNSVGTPETRRAYGEALRTWIAPVRDMLSEDSQRRLEMNPLRLLDSKDPRDLAFIDSSRSGAGAVPASEDQKRRFEAFLPRLNDRPRMLDHLDSDSRAHWDEVLRGLESLGIAHEIDDGLVRGLDYYTRTAFEVHDRSLGAQSALGGGGRYDGLIEALGGPSTPGVGFSIGLDRVLMAIAERGGGDAEPRAEVYVAAMEATRAEALRLVRELRREFRVDCDLETRAIGAQMKAADRSGAAALVLLGEEEWTRGEVVLKDLRTGSQRNISRGQLRDSLRETISAGEPDRTPAD